MVGSNRPKLTVENELVLEAWNLMRGLEWAAIPCMVEMLGVDDVPGFIFGLVQIREHMRANEKKDD